MIIFGCPVGVRHLIRIAEDQFRRLVRQFRPKLAGRIHFVYFSCARDMQLLTLSLQSLRLVRNDRNGGVFVVVDSKSPFSVEQQSELRDIIPDLEFLELGQIDWASIHTLKTELHAFGIVANRADAGDFVAKVDSDILFFSSDKLDEVSASASDFVGDGHYSRYKYAQGGLYFLRAPLAKDLQLVAELEISEAVAECNTRAEDQVVSALVRRRTRNIWLTRLMLFPNEFEKANLNGRWVRKEFCAIHFVHRKADMFPYGARLGLA
jgi:hypothetical protein